MARTPVHSLVLFAKDKKRLSAFYQQVLGLAVAATDRHHDLLQGRGIELVIHAIPPKYAAEIVIAKPPAPREDTPMKPVFRVRSLATVRRHIEAHGGFLKPAEQAWDIRGHTVLDGWDPEGNVLQFRQPVR
ncbi:MAG: hypothetical protein JNM33_18070 [Rubrivivax sp.]|nr:hypothetical protein [Rubrivivax sp.]